MIENALSSRNTIVYYFNKMFLFSLLTEFFIRSLEGNLNYHVFGTHELKITNGIFRSFWRVKAQKRKIILQVCKHLELIILKIIFVKWIIFLSVKFNYFIVNALFLMLQTLKLNRKNCKT
jgi:hypothetical protein